MGTNLKDLPESLVKVAAIKYYNSCKGATLPENVRQKVQDNALQLTLKTIRDKIQNEKENILKSYRDELLVSGLLTPETADDLKVIILRNLEHGTFMNILLDNLRASRSDLFRQHGIERVILSPGHLFDLSTKKEKDFIPRFLATLNLCNRSSRRHLRNLHDDNLQRKTDEVHPRGWKFPQSSNWPVVDNHKFTTKGKRNDETLELGGYNAVYDLITGIQANLNKYSVEEGFLEVTDKYIASWR